VTVALRAGEETIEERTVTLPAPAGAAGAAGTADAAGAVPRAEVTFEFVPRAEGYREYVVEVPPRPGEMLEENNVRRFALTVAKRPLRVLYMEGSEYRRPDSLFGYWEHEYLVRALEEDPDIRVTALLRKDARAAAAAGISWIGDPEHGWPRKKADLFHYDVIISSDIDVEFFSQGALRETVEFVGRHGGGFVMIGGWTAFGSGGYDESIIDRMLPVDMLGRHEGYKEYRQLPGAGFHWEVTAAGWRHPLMRVEADPAKNRAAWAACPEFYGYNRVQRAKPAATVLAVHADDENLYGKQVVLAVQPYGRGRSMALTTDTTAGWGLRFEEEWGDGEDQNLHYRIFWRNAVRWLAEYRLNAPGRLVTIATGRALYERGEKTPIAVSVLDEDYRPAADAAVRLTIRPESGEARELEAAPDFKSPGRYTAELVFDGTGRWEIAAVAEQGGKRLGEDKITVWVDPPTTEFRDCGLHRKLLTRLAHQTGGRYLPATEYRRAAAEVREAARLAEREEWRDAWERPLLFLLVAGLLALEWFLRKRAGLP